MLLEDSIETVKYFGLSYNQAKVYLAIASSKYFTVNETQRKAGVPRQKIYGILRVLEEIGLVQKTLERPLRFRGIPVKEGLRFLQKLHCEETRKMNEKAEEIIKNYNPTIFNHINGVFGIHPNFVITSKKEASIKKRREEIENAETEIDFITSWKRFPATVSTFEDVVEKALERGVNIKVILEKPEELDQIPEQIHDFENYPNYELRYIFKPPKAILGIFDRKRAICKTSASVGLAEAPSLWTDNPCLVSLLSEHFEIMWITALETILEQIC